MIHPLPCTALSVTPEIVLYHKGPNLDLGPLPAVFYFALSGQDSLCLDPYNQPIEYLAGQMIRTFSLTLPAHEAPLSPHDALGIWAEDFSKGIDCLQVCIDQIQIALRFAIEKGFVDPEKVAIAGLSRGGLIAAFAAAEEPLFRYLLAFAPVTKLGETKEFLPLQDSPLVRFYDAARLAPLLADRCVRIYIGNRDERVSTKHCFDFTMELVEKAHAARIRPAQIELIISPSIGHMGHGTSPDVFHQGAKWLIECLQ